MKLSLQQRKPDASAHERGAGLIEALVAVAIIGIGVKLAADHFGQVNSVQRYNGALITMNQLAVTIGQFASSRGALLWSSQIAGNSQALKRCIAVDSAQPCQHNAEEDFRLYNPGVTTLLAGTSNQPALYDLHGNLCAERCAFRTFTRFRAVCSQGATCNQAQSIMVNYTVEAIDNSAVWIPASSNPDVTVNINSLSRPRPISITKQLDINFERIWERLNVSCTAQGVDHVLVGINWKMQAICEPL